jgi:DNA/RNA endonuclease YhcR with UshA esterase domain
MPTFACHLSRNQPTATVRKFHSRWLVFFFVGLLCTAIANQATLAADASLTPIATITKATVSKEVTVQATISGIREPSSPRAPYNIMLTQDGATLPLIFWADMLPQLGSKVKVGNVVRVTALVNLYREILQLRLHDPSSLTVVTEAAGGVALTAPAAASTTTANTPAPQAPAETVIGAIKPDWVDRVVIISGTIAASDSTDKTQRVSVQDATGEIQVVFGEKALSGLPVAQLQPGHVITVTGPVKLENGTRTIVPDAASAVKFAP